MIPADMHPGSLFQTNGFGRIEVLEYKTSQYIRARFVDTGTVVITRSIQLRKGQVKDNYKPFVCGVGFIGEGKFRSADSPSTYQAYICWRNMLRRCYSEKHRASSKSYAGCTVSADWHNFQNFAEWFIAKMPKDGGDYDLDKDTLVPGNKLYSPSTCLIIERRTNILHSIDKRRKVRTLVSPNGDVVSFNNFNQFCSENNLNVGSLSKLFKGLVKRHKGWRLTNER